MNAERLLTHYEKIADAPDAIARLRRFILDLAVRGKLVPQDARDEPASGLLKRIAKEKARLLKAGEIKVRSNSARDREEPVAFDCPVGWTLTNLGEVALKITDGAHKTPTYVEKAPQYDAGHGAVHRLPAQPQLFERRQLVREQSVLQDRARRAVQHRE